MTFQDSPKQINPPDSTSKIIETLGLFNINFNNNENNNNNNDNNNNNNNCGCRNDVAVFDKFDADGISVFSFKKHAFVDTLILVYRKQSMQMQKIFQMLQFLLATNFIVIIAGEFHYNLLKVPENKFLDR